MRFIIAVAIACSVVSSATAFCGAEAGSKELLQSVQQHIAAVAASKPEVTSNGTKAYGAFVVPTVWNVFYDQNNPQDGNIPDTTITNTMKIVNQYFAPAGLTFKVTNVTRRATSFNNLHGATIGNDVDVKYIRSFHTGNQRTLNIYTVGKYMGSGTAYAGWSSFPWDYQAKPGQDGITFDYNYLAGGTYPKYNTGKVLAHEVGHWVGLLHTFQDGCIDGNNGGDYVADTPAEASPASGCPTGRDSCPTMRGADPINNLMDYSDDTCRTGFTDGQYNRFVNAIYQYRGIYLF